MPVLLDTHAAIWSANGTLARAVMKRIDAAAEQNELLISSITAWEIGMLAKKKRIAMAEPVIDYVRDLYAAAGVVTAPLTPAIALSAATLDSTQITDPADRILIATAVHFSADFITRDRVLLRFAEATQMVRCVAC